MKHSQSSRSIRWNLYTMFGAFLIILLTLLWLFQTVFLGSFYRTIKKQSIASTAQEVARRYKKEGNLESLSQMAFQNEFHIRVVTDQGLLISESVGVPSVWIQNILSTQYRQLYETARSSGDSIFLTINDNDPAQPAKNEYLTYVSIVDPTTMVVIQALVVPVGATVSTLQIQLMILTALLVVCAWILSWYFARRLANPLEILNEESRILGITEETDPFSAGGYKEVNELSVALNEAHAKLSVITTMQRELLANVSHDLKTPLTMIQGYAELMRDLDTERTEDNAQIVLEEAQHLTRLVEDMLDLSKLQEGVHVLNDDPFNVHDVVQETLTRYDLLQDAKHAKLSEDIPREIVARGDLLKIKQVLYNLINNALQYGDEGVSVMVRAYECDHRVRIEICDDGPGMSEEDQKVVWDRYVRSEQDHTRAIIGSGLGLSIVKQILQLHNVPFGLESEDGKGTLFWFELPKVEKETE